MAFIFFNDRFVEDSTPLFTGENRSLKYGDGLFETIKFKNGELILFNEHANRLWKGLNLLQFELPVLFTPEHIKTKTLQLLKKNQLPAARVKITILRGNGGLNDPENHHPNLLIQTWPLPIFNGSLNENGVELLLYKKAIKPIDYFSNCKHNNFLPYFMGALEAKKLKKNDALIFNSNGNICDTTMANIFIIKNKTILTPHLSEGCIAGVMRDFVITQLTINGFLIKEQPVSESMVFNADEIFLTNSIYNIRWVKMIEDKFYEKKIILQIFSTLSKTNPEVFC